MKGIISVVILVPTLQIFAFSVVPFNFKCPLQAHWKMRAKVKCNSTLKYFCLFNNVDGKYVEGCNGPDWDRKGCKRIYAGDFTRANCTRERFQPFKFRTNESMSDCIYAKSICSDNGQIVYIDDSRKDDRTCRCDYKRNYSFVKTPRHLCYCIPTEEDCSCFMKSCPVNFSLSTDYECIQNGNQKSSKCAKITKYYKTLEEKNLMPMHMGLHELTSRWRDTAATIIFWCICFMFITVSILFFVAVLFSKWTCKKLEPLKGFIFRRQTASTYTKIAIVADSEQTVAENKIVEGTHHESTESTSDSQKVTDVQNEIESMDNDNRMCQVTSEHSPEETTFKECVATEVQQPIDYTKLTTDGVYYLRMIHLIFRVACPVVRMFFNHEIEPNDLCKILHKNIGRLRKRYRRRKQEMIINDAQWNLIENKNGNTVTSDDFDTRLMIYILSSIANIEVGDLYPVETDMSKDAMLSRIKFIRNETTQSIEGKLSEDKFNQYWDDIGQALLKLLTSLIPIRRNDKDKLQIIERLLTLNPIDVDNKKLCRFIDMSEKYPAVILRRLLSEYCTFKKTTIKGILLKQKHELYHKRQKTDKCCLCVGNPLATYMKVLTEKQWETLYELTSFKSSHRCPLDLNICSEKIVPRCGFDLQLCDLTTVVSLILHIPEFLSLFISNFCTNGYRHLLINNQHTIYHAMGKTRCCKCETDPTEKSMITDEEWNKICIFKNDNISCKIDNCCCQFLVKERIEYSDIGELLWTKILHLVGPFRTINIIGQDTFSYFLSLNDHDQQLECMLTDLKRVLTSAREQLNKKKLRSGSSNCLPQLGENIANTVDVQNWIATHLREQTSTLKSLFIIVSDKDCLKIKSIPIPNKFTEFVKTRKFKDLTPDENNFLVVVHALQTIVRHVIKSLFNTKFKDYEFICKEIYYGKSKNEVSNRCRKVKIHFSDRQRRELFSPKLNGLPNWNLKLMICILKLTPEDNNTVSNNNEWKKEVNVINEIRREIMQSSSGVLEEKRFTEIMEAICKAVLHLGGEQYQEELLYLRSIRNILE